MQCGGCQNQPYHVVLHQGLEMALAELQRKPFGENRSHVTEAHGKLKERNKNRAPFEDKIPVNYRTTVKKKTPDFPRENSSIFVMKIKSFTLAKATLFKKTLKTLARFSPQRDVCVYIYIYIYVMGVRGNH